MSIISNAKEIADLVKKLGNVDLYRKIVELEGEIIELTREKHVLEERVRGLEGELKIKGQLSFDGKAYWLQEANNTSGPYCQHCYDVDGKLVRLQSWEDAWMCFGCKNTVEK